MGKKYKIKKITHILYSGLGGTYDVCNILGKLDTKLNTKSTFIQIGPTRFNKLISQKNQTTYFIKTFRFFTIFYFLSVLSILIREKPNLVILHNYQIIPVFLYKLLFFKNLTIIYVDHTPNNLKSFKDFFVCKFFKFIIDFFVTLNKDSFKYFIDKIKISKNRIKIIPNAVNQNFIRKKIFINNLKKTVIFGMASRINNLKRHDLIVDVLQSEPLKDENIICYFAGSGENINFLKKKIKNKNKFKFFGALNSYDLKKWYQSLDFYIQATTGEGHSTSILQAMGMNLPILGSNVSGVKNFLYPKRNIGITFENNENSLISKIRSITKMTNNKRKIIVSSQKKYLLENFTEITFLNSYEKIIKKLVFNKNST